MTEAQLLESVAADRRTYPGWCSAEKAQKLVRTILEGKPALAVEIGVFGGSSLIPQAMAFKFLGQGKIVGIDPWSRDAALEEMKADRNIQWWSKTVDLEKIHRICLGHVSRLELTGFCEIMRARSEVVAPRFEDASIGLLHIDGNHSEVHSLRDATLYFPKVVAGGFIYFDDFSWREQSVWTTRRAIGYLQENGCDLVDRTGDCVILRKGTNGGRA